MKLVKYLVAIALALFAVFGLQSFEKPTEGTALSDLMASRYGIYEYTFTTDTITNTEADTLTISPLLLSKWSYNWSFAIDSLSGTPNIAIKVQESNKRSGSEWYTLETSTVSGIGSTQSVTTHNGDNTENPDGKVRGVRQRVILTGTGTESTLYSVKLTLKKY